MRVSLAVACLLFVIVAGCGQSAQQDLCGGRTTDMRSDPLNCGACSNACPAPVHAAATCDAGACGRGPCDPGWYDLDASVLGCEAGGEGITAAPLPETGLVFQTFASGSSYGGRFQANGHFTNVGVLGESTPPAVNGAVSETSAEHKNIGGLNAMQH
jgi:hypothetical protein